MKVCTGCKETKLLTEFYGKLAQCKHCNKKKRDSLTEDEMVDRVINELDLHNKK